MSKRDDFINKPDFIDFIFIDFKSLGKAVPKKIMRGPKVNDHKILSATQLSFYEKFFQAPEGKS